MTYKKIKCSLRYDKKHIFVLKIFDNLEDLRHSAEAYNKRALKKGLSLIPSPDKILAYFVLMNEISLGTIAICKRSSVGIIAHETTHLLQQLFYNLDLDPLSQHLIKIPGRTGFYEPFEDFAGLMQEVVDDIVEKRKSSG